MNLKRRVESMEKKQRPNTLIYQMVVTDITDDNKPKSYYYERIGLHGETVTLTEEEYKKETEMMHELNLPIIVNTRFDFSNLSDERLEEISKE